MTSMNKTPETPGGQDYDSSFASPESFFLTPESTPFNQLFIAAIFAFKNARNALFAACAASPVPLFESCATGRSGTLSSGASTPTAGLSGSWGASGASG